SGVPRGRRFAARDDGTFAFCSDNDIKEWDPRTGEIQTLHSMDEALDGVSVFADGSVIAFADRGTVVVWSRAFPKPAIVFLGEKIVGVATSKRARSAWVGLSTGEFLRLDLTTSPGDKGQAEARPWRLPLLSKLSWRAVMRQLPRDLRLFGAIA